LDYKEYNRIELIDNILCRSYNGSTGLYIKMIIEIDGIYERFGFDDYHDFIKVRNYDNYGTDGYILYKCRFEDYCKYEGELEIDWDRIKLKIDMVDRDSDKLVILLVINKCIGYYYCPNKKKELVCEFLRSDVKLRNQLLTYEEYIIKSIIE